MLTNNKTKLIMKDWKKEANIKGTILYRLRHKYSDEVLKDEANYVLTVCTNQPGPLIGKMGSLIDKYRRILNYEASDENKISINIIETDGIV